MRRYLSLSVFACVVMTTTHSCIKEKQSFTTVPEKEVKPPKPVEPKVPVRNEILAAVYTLGNPDLPGKLLAYDYNGNIVREKVIDKACLNFQRWLINNEFRYTYLEHSDDVHQEPGVGYVPGDIVVLDKDFNEIDRINILPYKDRTANQLRGVDLHEFIYLADNHYIAMAYYITTVNNIPASLNPASNIKVVDCVIQEVKNGAVVFEWHSVDYPELYELSTQSNAFSDTSAVYDYFHLNGISIDPSDNNLILSARNTSQVYKINHATGEIIWRLGGNSSDFPLTDEQKFHRQHHATITDGGKTLLLFDNGQRGLREYSRIVEYNLDHLTQTVRSFKATHVPNGIFGEYMGSVQKTDSSYVIGCGSTPRIVEVNYNTLEVLLDIKLERPSYRAYKY